MLFNSLYFLIFFTIVVLIYYLIPFKSAQRIFLVIASIYFIFKANLLSLLVVGAIAVISYVLSIQIEKKRARPLGKVLFYTGLIINIGNLFFFKYYYFFLANLNDVFGFLKTSTSFSTLDLILPIGISFYTFSTLGYMIDIWRGNLKAEKIFISFLNYVLFFPKLLAGPIERAQNFLPQSRLIKNISIQNFSDGGKLIIWGFFQKLVIADRIAIYVNVVYKDVDKHSGITLLICSIFFVFQVYADFSGYTDIARGLGKILGYDLMINFRRPLLAFSISDFWRRWHISLSSWVNDYVYMPLSLKLRAYGKIGVILSLFISFIIIGIWHGANWTFVIFGILQGIFISSELLFSRKKKKFFKGIPKWISTGSRIFITFIIITISLIFFRAPTLKTALTVLSRVISPGKIFIGAASFFVYSLIGIFLIALNDVFLEFFQKNIFKIKSSYFILRSLPYALLVITILVIGVFDGGQFIYFNF